MKDEVGTDYPLKKTQDIATTSLVPDSSFYAQLLEKTGEVLSQHPPSSSVHEGAQWLSGRVLDSRPRGCGLEPHRRHCIVSLSKTH